ncbi:unnamed protein product [Owenia fusiformis]|uniref:Uncharacterized protein n=1 Tax=Owenia fusiformis TaxID=6347 RepID=A0A8J1TZB1_OWEFU|nr:unnamed protein product [Owenia fusiformis]
MPMCCAANCSNITTDRPKLGISFHLVPDLKRAKGKRHVVSAWLTNIGRFGPGWTVDTFKNQKPREVVVCSQHFNPDDFERDFRSELMPGYTQKKRKLKEDAIPSIFSHKKTNERPALYLQKREQNQQKTDSRLQSNGQTEVQAPTFSHILLGKLDESEACINAKENEQHFNTPDPCKDCILRTQKVFCEAATQRKPPNCQTLKAALARTSAPHIHPLTNILSPVSSPMKVVSDHDDSLLLTTSVSTRYEQNNNYIPSSESNSDFEDEENHLRPGEIYTSEQKYNCFESCLDKVFYQIKCHQCNAQVTNIERHVVGTLYKVKLQCISEHNVCTWSSREPYLGKQPAGNLCIATATLLTAKIMREEYKQKYIDHNHVVSNIKKKLVEKGKCATNRDIFVWIKPITNHFWYCAKTCGGDELRLKEKWLSILKHILNQHDFPQNMVFKECDHPELTQDQVRRKKWLTEDSSPYKAIKDVITDSRLLADLANLIKHYHTGCLEVYHSMLNKHLPSTLNMTSDKFKMVA